MTIQTLISKASSESVSMSSSAATINTDGTACVLQDPHQMRLLQSLKAQYRLDQQEKFLHLQAETESLLQQLKAIKQQRQATATVEHR